MADSNGVEAGGSDDTRDAAGEAVVEGIVFGSSNGADDGDACDNADNGDACDDVDDGEACENADDGDELNDAEGALMAMNVLVPGGTVLMAVVVLTTLLRVQKPHS